MKKREENNHLAMLAVPIVLSMLITVSGFTVSGNSSRSEESGQQANKNAVLNKGKNDDEEINPRLKAMQMAVTTADYQAFLTSMEHTPLADVMTETAFVEVVKRYQAHLLG